MNKDGLVGRYDLKLTSSLVEYPAVPKLDTTLKLLVTYPCAAKIAGKYYKWVRQIADLEVNVGKGKVLFQGSQVRMISEMVRESVPAAYKWASF